MPSWEDLGFIDTVVAHIWKPSKHSLPWEEEMSALGIFLPEKLPQSLLWKGTQLLNHATTLTNNSPVMESAGIRQPKTEKIELQHSSLIRMSILKSEYAFSLQIDSKGRKS